MNDSEKFMNEQWGMYDEEGEIFEPDDINAFTKWLDGKAESDIYYDTIREAYSVYQKEIKSR